VTKPLPLPQPCKLLPPEARGMLISATRVQDPMQRLVAIDNAIDKVKLHYPMYFKPTPQL
jgi:hypothetical protein